MKAGWGSKNSEAVPLHILARSRCPR